MFGQKLKYVRELNSITKCNLAKAIGVSTSTLSSWENGTSTPNVYLLTNICNVLNISANFLLGLDDKLMLNASNMSDNTIKFFFKVKHHIEID